MKKPQNLRNQAQQNTSLDHLAKRFHHEPPKKPSPRGVIASATYIHGIMNREPRK